MTSATARAALALFQDDRSDVAPKDGWSQWDYNDFFCTGWLTLKDGWIDENAVTVFTRGHCHSLALAIQELTDCELAATYDGEWLHVVAEISDGVYLDINNDLLCEDMVLDDDYSDAVTLDRVARADVEGWVEAGEYRPLRIEDAMPFARAVCAANGIETGQLAAAA